MHYGPEREDEIIATFKRQFARQYTEFVEKPIREEGLDAFLYPALVNMVIGYNEAQQDYNEAQQAYILANLERYLVTQFSQKEELDKTLDPFLLQDLINLSAEYQLPLHPNMGDLAPVDRAEYLTNPFHAAWRYLFATPNPFLEQNAGFVNAGDENKELIAYLWVAIHCLPESQRENFKRLFAQTLSDIGRALSEAPTISGDSPSCPAGVKVRLCQFLELIAPSIPGVQLPIILNKRSLLMVFEDAFLSSNLSYGFVSYLNTLGPNDLGRLNNALDNLVINLSDESDLDEADLAALRPLQLDKKTIAEFIKLCHEKFGQKLFAQQTVRAVDLSEYNSFDQYIRNFLSNKWYYMEFLNKVKFLIEKRLKNISAEIAAKEKEESDGKEVKEMKETKETQETRSQGVTLIPLMTLTQQRMREASSLTEITVPAIALTDNQTQWNQIMALVNQNITSGYTLFKEAITEIRQFIIAHQAEFSNPNNRKELDESLLAMQKYQSNTNLFPSQKERIQDILNKLKEMLPQEIVRLEPY